MAGSHACSRDLCEACAAPRRCAMNYLLTPNAAVRGRFANEYSVMQRRDTLKIGIQVPGLAQAPALVAVLLVLLLP